MDPVFRLRQWRLTRLEIAFPSDDAVPPDGEPIVDFETPVGMRLSPDGASAFIDMGLAAGDNRCDQPSVEAGAQAIYDADWPADPGPDAERRVLEQIAGDLFERLHDFISGLLLLGVGAGLADRAPLQASGDEARLVHMRTLKISFQLNEFEEEACDMVMRVDGRGEPDGDGADFLYRLTAGGPPPSPCQLEILVMARFEFPPSDRRSGPAAGPWPGGYDPDGGDPDAAGALRLEDFDPDMTSLASAALYQLVSSILELAGLPPSTQTPGTSPDTRH